MIATPRDHRWNFPIPSDLGLGLVLAIRPWHDSAMPRSSISLFRRIERALETIALGSDPLETIQLTSQVLADTFTEAAPEGSLEEYGEDRLLHVMQAVRHLDPVAIVDRVFMDVGEFSEISPPTDDQTLVIVKRRPKDLEESPA